MALVVTLGTTDVSEYVQTVRLTVGHRAQNAIGSVSPGSYGVVQFNAVKNNGAMNAYSPAAGIDTGPLVPIIINKDSVRIFTGWSTGIQTQLQLNGQHVSTCAVIGAYQYLLRQHPRIFTTLASHVGTLRTGQLVDIILNEANWTGARRISSGQTTLLPFKVRSSGILGSGARPAGVGAALLACAQAEMGRFYDSRTGELVFEDRMVRGDVPTGATSLPKYTIGDQNEGLSVKRVETRPVDEAVINIITGSTKSFRDKGAQEIKFTNGSYNNGSGVKTTLTDYEDEDTLWLTPDFEVYTERVNNEDAPIRGITHIDSYTRMVKGTHYRVTSGDTAATLGMLFDGDQLGLQVSTTSKATIEVLSIQGHPQQEDFGRAVTLRDNTSVARYGEKQLTFPNELVDNLGELREHLQFILAVHNGVVDEPGETVGYVAPYHSLDLEVLLTTDAHPLLAASPSEVVQLTNAQAGIASQLFFINEVEHTVALDGTHRMKLKLVDAFATVMWHSDRFLVGQTTRVGF